MLKELLDAVREGKLDRTKALIHRYPVEVNKVEENKGIVSVEEIRKRLINLPDKDNGNTLLHYAIMDEQVTILEYLVTLDGIDANLPNHSKETPLMLAVKNKQIEVVKSLFTITDININLRDNDGKTPLLKAASNGSIELCNLLFMHPSIEIQVRDKSGKNALDYLSEKEALDKLSNDSINRIKKFYPEFEVDIPESWMHSPDEKNAKLIAIFQLPPSLSEAMGPQSMLIDYNYQYLSGVLSAVLNSGDVKK